MKKVMIPLTAVAAFTLSASTFAATTNTAASTSTLSAQVNKLNAETKQLEHKVWVLEHAKHAKKVHHKRRVAHVVHTVKEQGPAISKAKNEPWDHFVTVTTTPFLGRHTDFDGDDLLYNVSTNNEDLRLLKQKAALENQMAAEGYSLDRPILQLSGAVEAQGFSQSGFNSGTNNGVNLSTAELDLNAIASSWATAFMAMDFNGAPISSGNRYPNSSIYLGRGFATIGNLNRFPVYFTAGLMNVPFGRFANGMVSTPLTQSMNQVRDPAALLGFSLHNGLFGSIYGYSGNQTSGGQPIFKQWGVNGGYKHKFYSDDHFTLGAGWISNIADAQGQQNTGLNTATGQFGGFGVATPTSANNNALVHSVDALDAHGSLTVGAINLIGEYAGALEAYAPQDMTFNGTTTGAQPQAAHAEIDWALPFFAKKYGTSLGFAYGHAWQALALNLPENSYSVFLNTSIWRETTESIEFRHDTDYAAGTIATGRGATTNIVGTGNSRNSVLVQAGVYF